MEKEKILPFQSKMTGAILIFPSTFDKENFFCLLNQPTELFIVIITQKTKTNPPEVIKEK